MLDFQDVSINIDDDGFSIQAQFPEVVPITERTESARAELLHKKLRSSLQSRLEVFGRLLNLVARKGTLKHWQELDVCLTSLAMLLKEHDLDEAVECLKSAVTGIAALAAGDDSHD